MSERKIVFAGAIMGGLAVMLGAFGAHALKAMLVANDSVNTFEVAARYQMYHALLLIGIGILMQRSENKSRLLWAAVVVMLGTLLFSGSLYVLALISIRFVALLTPVGGLLLIVGWGILAAAVFASGRDE